MACFAAGALLCSCFTSGCALSAQIPKTSVSGTISGQPFTLITPKDSKLTGLRIEAQGGAFTNWCRISIESLEAHMNPEVITTTADGQAKLIQSVGDATAKAFQAGGAAAGSALGAAAGAAVK